MKKHSKLKLICLLTAAALAVQTCCAAAPADSGNSDSCVFFSSDAGAAVKESETLEFEISVKEKDFYRLGFCYSAADESNVTPQAGIEITAEGLGNIEKTVDFPRIWKNDISGESGGRFERDAMGNELLPDQRQITEKESIFPEMTDSGVLELAAGTVRLRITMLRQSVRLYRVYLEKNKKADSYAEYISKINGGSAGKTVFCEAELTDAKSHLEIGLNYDRTSPSVSPNDPVKIYYNILGGSAYSVEGQWAQWSFEVPESGFYNMNFCYRQNINNGLSSRRILYIDGEIPFEECGLIEFPYSEDFKIHTLSDGKEPYKIYLKKGSHTVRLEVTLKGQKELIKRMNTAISGLNGLYSEMMIIVGETPDAYRDYNLDESIPELKDSLKKYAEELNELGNMLDDGKEQNGSTARVYEAARTFEKMSGNAREIPQQLDNFRSQINTLADLLGSIRSQPLELDYITLTPPGYEPESEKTDFTDYIKFRLKAFIGSFVSDYTAVSKSGNDRVNVWVSSNDISIFGYSTGRDQAQILDRLISNGFTPNSGVSVKLSLINSSDTLLPALVSGKGPDAALFIPKTVLMNLYYRGALVDLRAKMQNYESVSKRFYPASLISLSVGESAYALPEVMSYNMMFYRTDIFERYGIESPETWEDFYGMLAVLQNAGMQAGIAESTQVFEMLLLQEGGTLYNSDISKSMLTEQPAIRAFTRWTELYTKYGLPYTFDALNRFRTGQMPIIFSSASFYGQLAVGAPEISGLWAMACVPGIKQNGGVNRGETCNISGAAVLESSKRKENAMRFIDWWTSDEVQRKFGTASETQLGASARYFSANRSVLPTLSWTAEEYRVLTAQCGEMSDNPQSPAAYYVTRNLSNAYRRVIYQLENPRDVIFRYCKNIDDELQRKRIELGMEEEK